MKVNIQPIEKKLKGAPGTHLEVVGVFLTIQGEGPFAGHKAVFVRLAGCNLQCPGCDTDYTTDRCKLRIEGIVKKVQSLSPKGTLVVITGGEPFRQEIAPFANSLVCAGYKVQVETNGTLPPSAELMKEVVIVCSPKAGKINKKLAERANCFKYVMHANSVAEDGLPILALGHSAHPVVARPPEGSKAPIYLQPMDSQSKVQNCLNMRAVLNSCIKNGYILQLQIHKILGVE